MNRPRAIPLAEAPAPALDPDHAWDRHAAVAAQLLKGREQGYPALVAAGRLDAADAARRIAIMRAIAAIWAAAWEARLPDPALLRHDGATIDRCDIIAELDRARANTAARITREPDNPAAPQQLATIDAMIAWHRRWEDGPLFCVRITLQLRTLHATQERHAA